jgi:hypothetical protein
MKKILLILFAIGFVSCKQDVSDSPVELEVLSVDTLVSGAQNENLLVKVDSAKIKELKPLFKYKKDEFSEDQTEWITPIASSRYRNENGMYCYFSKDNLRFVFQYHADSWLFIRTCQFLIDDKPYTYTPEEVKRDNDETGITEWVDASVSTSSDLKAIVEALAVAKTAKVRLNGDNYYEVKNFSAKQIKSVKNTLAYYKALGNSI